MSPYKLPVDISFFSGSSRPLELPWRLKVEVDEALQFFIKTGPALSSSSAIGMALTPGSAIRLEPQPCWTPLRIDGAGDVDFDLFELDGDPGDDTCGNLVPLYNLATGALIIENKDDSAADELAGMVDEDDDDVNA